MRQQSIVLPEQAEHSEKDFSQKIFKSYGKQGILQSEEGIFYLDLPLISHVLHPFTES